MKQLNKINVIPIKLVKTCSNSNALKYKRS